MRAVTWTWRWASKACSGATMAVPRFRASPRSAPPPGRRVATRTMGRGFDVLLLHGLGGAKTSFFDTAAALSNAGYRVHALDFPGFGFSSKPATAPYSSRYFAETVVGVMDALGIERAHLVGNSMGGRVALEVGLRTPE